MKVFKFGGASLKDASGVRNAAEIVRSVEPPLVIVVSAMGKTTNQLEKILMQSQQGTSTAEAWKQLTDYHLHIIDHLWAEPAPVFDRFQQLINDAKAVLENPVGSFDQLYDQLICYGELISSCIVFEYFSAAGLRVKHVDARKVVVTDDTFREGKVMWDRTCSNIRLYEPKDDIVITQGFIGGTDEGMTTTLGREGSDFTAAIWGACLNAERVTIWKDVPGVMNADPKRWPHAVVFPELPFKEAAEMTYYGASIIHPKTIKPLANKGIPLFVKSFVDPSLPGTVIHECKLQHLPPLFVFKDAQCLISCKVTDYTFIDEQQLSIIFHSLSALNIRVNMMQNSAISFSFCIDFSQSKVSDLIDQLQHHFEVYYNTGLTLITIKNCTPEISEKYRSGKDILLEQSSRSTLQLLVRE